MIMDADIALTHLGLKFILLAYLKATLHLTCHVSCGFVGWRGFSIFGCIDVLFQATCWKVTDLLAG